MLLTEPKILRAQAVWQALTRQQHRAVPTAPELSILTQYVLGSLSLEQTNAMLRQHGRAILAAPATLAA